MALGDMRSRGAPEMTKTSNMIAATLAQASITARSAWTHRGRAARPAHRRRPAADEPRHRLQSRARLRGDRFASPQCTTSQTFRSRSRLPITSLTDRVMEANLPWRDPPNELGGSPGGTGDLGEKSSDAVPFQRTPVRPVGEQWWSQNWCSGCPLPRVVAASAP